MFGSRDPSEYLGMTITVVSEDLDGAAGSPCDDEDCAPPSFAIGAPVNLANHIFFADGFLGFSRDRPACCARIASNVKHPRLLEKDSDYTAVAVAL